MTKILKELYKNRDDKNARIEIIQDAIMLYIKKFIDDESAQWLRMWIIKFFNITEEDLK